MKKNITIGTRGSKLALWQATWVKSKLQDSFPDLSIKLEIIKTKGDKILDVPLAEVGGKGLFVKEIEAALIDKKIDIAVHSMKDMPAEIPHGITIGAVPQRANPKDVLISKNHLKLAELPLKSRIGTSSLRRTSQLLHFRSDLEIFPLRGNLDTRLRKLDSENLDAIILAAAGIERLGQPNRITEYIEEDVILPAVGQGALCIEIRENDPEINSITAFLDDPETNTIVSGERAFLKRLQGGCQVPIAALGTIKNKKYILTGLVADIDGKKVIKDSFSSPLDKAIDVGIQLANHLFEKGADKILKKLISAT